MSQSGFFTTPLASSDPDLAKAIELELGRQRHEIELIASENIVSRAVLEAQGSVLTNKYAEGYPGKRYYGGCQYVDIAENLAIERAKQLFGCGFANVQPNSGSQANQSVFLALATAGRHLHGPRSRRRRPSDAWFAREPVRQAGSSRCPTPSARTTTASTWSRSRRSPRSISRRCIIAGGSGYSRIWDFEAFRKIADSVGAYFMVDMAHFAGLVAAGLHPSPFPHAHVVTTTTHKTLRGPRGGMVLTNDEDIAKKINSAVFPGLQGGPLMHVIAGKAVAFGEALKPEFKVYQQQVKDNARVLAETLVAAGFAIVSGGTDNHLMLVDLRPKKITGKAAEAALGRAHITCNKNGIPFDPEKPFVTSGIRLGSPAATSRGFGAAEFSQVGGLIVEVLDGLAVNGEAGNAATEAAVKEKVHALTAKFPIY